MKRKTFISSIFPAAFVLHPSQLLMEKENTPAEVEAIKPACLKKGDTIGITCPAGFITTEDIQPALAIIKDWGFDVLVGETVGKKDFSFGGTDAERLADFQQLLDNKKVNAILCARGGYGAVRIIDQIDFTTFARHPKWIIGFSDVTVLHSHINRNFGVATIHSKMCNSFPTDWNNAEPMQIESIESIRQCLVGEKINYNIAPNSHNKAGRASGIVVGGNLKTIESLAGSRSDLITKNKILFVEDTGEYLYSIDRMFWNLKRTGKLDHLKGLLIGGFKTKKEETDADAFGKTLEEIVLEKVKAFNYPVCFDFPVGHQKNNFAIKCGVTHQLTVTPTACTLNEIK